VCSVPAGTSLAGDTTVQYCSDGSDNQPSV
jgi:hypothetical protein